MSWLSIINCIFTIGGWCLTLFKIIFPFLKKATPYIFCFVLGWMACSNRIFSRHHAETIIGTETAIDVTGGNHITVVAGMFGRKYSDLYLWGIEIPSVVKQQSQNNLSKLIAPNDDIRVEVMETWGTYSGIIYADNGNNCCLEQLRAGLAKSTVDRRDFKEAQKEAQKAHRGIWGL